MSLSIDRKWLLTTTSDVPETTIAEMAEPTLYLAGRRFQTQPRYRIDFERTVRFLNSSPGALKNDTVIVTR